MRIIAHRRNTVEQLRATPSEYGVELDLRSWNDELVIHHDPFVRGESFERWLESMEVVPTVAASVDLVVHVGTDPSGRRRVREIVALPGRAENGVVETADVFTTRDGRLVRADGYPPHADRFAARGLDLAGLLA